MTTPNLLSPAAQAVMTAILEISPAPADEIAAVALRAAAEAYREDSNGEGMTGFVEAIADELEAQ